MKSIAWNKKLHALTTAQIGTDNSTHARGIGAQHQNFNRIAKVKVIKLIVADPVQPHVCVGRYHKVESGPNWTAFCECGGSPPAAIHLLLMKVTRTNPHVAWGSSLRNARISQAVISFIIGFA